MNSLRYRLFKSKLFYLPIFAVIGGLSTYLISSALSKPKPIEKFSIFISGIDFNREVLRERIYSYKTEAYNYLLVFEAVTADEDDKDSYYPYDYVFENEAIPSSDIIIYSQSFFEKEYSSNAYEGHFDKISNPSSNMTLFNEYALKIHDKNDSSEDSILGITFGDDNYFASINKNTVHNSSKSDAARHFLEAFVHE